MKISVYDEEGNLADNPEKRERVLLAVEADRVKDFLADVGRMMDIPPNGIGEFTMVVDWLENVRRNDPDRAVDAERYLNRAAAIDADIYRHRKYIEKNGFSINIADYLS